MLLPRFALVCALPMLAAMPACQGKSTTPAPAATKAAQAADAKATAPASDVEAGAAGAPSVPPSMPMAADGGPSPAEVAAVEAGPAGVAGPEPVPSLQGDPQKALGAHLADPSWFRKTMFGEAAKVLDTKRSQADDAGRFSSLIRFEIPDMKPEGCADHLQELVKKDVPNVQRETKPDGRVQLTGTTDRYKLTFLCGEAQGKTIAYVSYQWT
jgi:hypothetical protein